MRLTSVITRCLSPPLEASAMSSARHRVLFRRARDTVTAGILYRVTLHNSLAMRLRRTRMRSALVVRT